jgi:amidase
MGDLPLHAVGAAEAVRRLRSGALGAERLAEACLARIAAEEPRVEAWQWLEPERVLAEARRIDRLDPRPPLAGLPVGVKDIIDTADLPTECGTPLRRGRRPAADARCVARLRAAGGIVLGKTVTTELAFFGPGKTRNPRDPSRTPGGSSSGSAAAVAALMVPAALGTQTAGSVIRPAAYCGVVGMKPTYGLLPLEGVSALAPSLDTLGIFVREVEDLPVVAGALGLDLGAPPLAAPPRVGLCRTEAWAQASPEVRANVERAAERLARAGAPVRELELPVACAGLARAQATIMAVEAARTFAEDKARGAALMSQKLLALLAEGEATPAAAHDQAQSRAAAARAAFPGVFRDVDVLLTASAPGEAPEGLASTGDPALNRIWTALGAPCLHLPRGVGPHGLPLGVQLVGAPRGDAALVAAAGWIDARLRA